MTDAGGDARDGRGGAEMPVVRPQDGGTGPCRRTAVSVSGVRRDALDGEAVAEIIERTPRRVRSLCARMGTPEREPGAIPAVFLSAERVPPRGEWRIPTDEGAAWIEAQWNGDRGRWYGRDRASPS